MLFSTCSRVLGSIKLPDGFFVGTYIKGSIFVLKGGNSIKLTQALVEPLNKLIHKF